MSILAAHIPLLFGTLCSILSVVSMSAITVTGFHYLRAMEATQARIRAEQQDSRQPRF
jgi:hypothetical protein